jgi:hypothetical protein
MERSTKRSRSSGAYNARFAGDVFLHEQNPEDGPIARQQTSEEAWKRPPSASLRAEVSV